MPRVRLTPVPDRERRLAAELPAERAVPERARRRARSARAAGSRTRARVAATKPARNRSTVRVRHSGYVAQRGIVVRARTSSSEEREEPPRAPRRREEEPKMRNAGRIESFVFDIDAYCVNGYAAHANGSVAASRRRRTASPRARAPSCRAGRTRATVQCAAGGRPTCPVQPKSEENPGRTRRTTPARRCRRGRSTPRSARSSGSARGSPPRRRRGRTASGRPAPGSARRAPRR